MLARYVMIFSAVFALGACSTNSDTVPVSDMENQNSVMIDGQDPVYADDLIPGSQADLVVNVGDRIFFETDSSDLTLSARSTLENQASWLGQYSSVGVVIEGHADERGTREYNLALGERRANAVKSYLVALGVSASRITTVSYGKERPAVPGANDQAWAQNRRSVTKVQ
ncbi:MAG: peptidoglycan-associated lipoprotein Pal [Alcanivorax sp.]